MTPNKHPEIQEYPIRGTVMPYVHYEKPDDNNRPLVMLNGISMPPDHWGQLPEELDREIISIGLPESSLVPRRPTIQGYGRTALQAIHDLAGKDYDLLGLSWGGLLAQQVALKDPDGPEHMVLAGTAPLAFGMYTSIPSPQALRKVASAKRNPDDAKYIYGGDIMNDPDMIKDLGIERDIDMVHHTRQQMALWTCGSLLVRNSLQQHRPKTLVMAGSDDPLMPFANVQKAARKLDAELRIVEDGGHGFLFTRPEWSADVINEFLDREYTQDGPAPTTQAA